MSDLPKVAVMTEDEQREEGKLLAFDAERSAWIAGLDEPGLKALRARLKSERRWPSGEAP